MCRNQILNGNISLGFFSISVSSHCCQKSRAYIFNNFLCDHLSMRSVYGPRWCLFAGCYGNDLIAKNQAGYPMCNHVSN